MRRTKLYHSLAQPTTIFTEKVRNQHQGRPLEHLPHRKTEAEERGGSFPKKNSALHRNRASTSQKLWGKSLGTRRRAGNQRKAGDRSSEEEVPEQGGRRGEAVTWRRWIIYHESGRRRGGGRWEASCHGRGPGTRWRGR